jgi:hypothetical protein
MVEVFFISEAEGRAEPKNKCRRSENYLVVEILTNREKNIQEILTVEGTCFHSEVVEISEKLLSNYPKSLGFSFL